MRAPTLGGNVEVLVKPNSTELRDDRVWCVWSQSPDGWWLMRRPEGGGAVEWDDQPARLLRPTKRAVTFDDD